FGGTGLGLLLSKKIAVLLGGNVDLLDSEPGVGSTFVVTAQVAPVRRLLQGRPCEYPRLLF
ncbi:MAG TPA: ATP-binding protein, partial [Oligoflexus sp.]|uniref:ATP-binding protein n=1 Tax=Oligoflexus sp. TaxID=1971216 RepID=UPI002D521439